MRGRLISTAQGSRMNGNQSNYVIDISCESGQIKPVE